MYVCTYSGIVSIFFSFLSSSASFPFALDPKHASNPTRSAWPSNIAQPLWSFPWCWSLSGDKASDWTISMHGTWTMPKLRHCLKNEIRMELVIRLVARIVPASIRDGESLGCHRYCLQYRSMLFVGPWALHLAGRYRAILIPSPPFRQSIFILFYSSCSLHFAFSSSSSLCCVYPSVDCAQRSSICILHLEIESRFLVIPYLLAHPSLLWTLADFSIPFSFRISFQQSFLIFIGKSIT